RLGVGGACILVAPQLGERHAQAIVGGGIVLADHRGRRVATRRERIVAAAVRLVAGFDQELGTLGGIHRGGRLLGRTAADRDQRQGECHAGARNAPGLAHEPPSGTASTISRAPRSSMRTASLTPSVSACEAGPSTSSRTTSRPSGLTTTASITR